MPKLYYSIKEVGEIFDEEQHILRYWEREFDHLKPQKNRAGNRIYTEKDFRLLRVIKKLVRIDRLSVAAAKDALLNGIPDGLNTTADTPTPHEESVLQRLGFVSQGGQYVKVPKATVEELIDV
ncbi:MAG: MerR family transcriptional regulator, partial [Candidatus Kapabacteria bacterium]|nr:MerR family transcriptional regulator [Candidatus Kapabacteria bacterium]